MSTERPAAVILTSVFVSPQNREVICGGSARVVLDLTRLLRDLGFDITVIQKGPRDDGFAFEPGLRVEIVRAPVRSWSDIVFALRTRRRANRAALCCYATPELGFPFYARHGIAIQHGIWWDGPGYRGLFGMVVRGIQWRRNLSMCRRLRAVICVDTNFINYLRAGGAPVESIGKCRYVPNCVSTSLLPAVSEADIERRFHSKRLLFLRRFEEDRGAELFVDICGRLRARGLTFSARMIGGGTRRESVTRLISARHLHDAIEIGERTLDDVYGVIGDSCISVIPSLWSEGTSLSAIESVALGVPVVATDVGGLGNVIMPHFNGFVARADAASLTNEIERLLTDQPLYTRMAQQCLSMRHAFSMERWRETVSSVLRDAGVAG